MKPIRSMQSRGGIARAKKYSKAKLKEWGKLGGRPRKLKVKSETPGDYKVEVNK
jgi:hypothetical protein